MRKTALRSTTPKSTSPHRVGRSSAGLGLFTNEGFKKGDFIIEYVGERISSKESDSRGTKYLFELNDRWTIDGAARSNTARYINHSCKPNAEVEIKRGRIIISAIKTIKPDEEICYNYGPNYFKAFIEPHGCKCAPCLGKVERKRRAARPKTTAARKTSTSTVAKKRTRRKAS